MKPSLVSSGLRYEFPSITTKRAGLRERKATMSDSWMPDVSSQTRTFKLRKLDKERRLRLVCWAMSHKNVLAAPARVNAGATL